MAGEVLYTPEEFYKMVQEVVSKNDKRKTHTSIREALGMSHATYYFYKDNEKYKDSFLLIASAIKDDMIDKALTNEYNAQFTQFLLKAEYRYIEHEKAEQLALKKGENKIAESIADNIKAFIFPDPYDYSEDE